ncbi:MAG: CCA tRNA nucleotidyltransferase [archaeon]
MKELLSKIKKELKPDNRVITEVDDTVKKINSLLKKEKIKADCVKGGSTAKGTFLKNDYDVDLFVRFDYSYKGKKISDILEPVLKKAFKIERVHGSRDYFQIQNKLLFEIVPVLKITDYRKAANVTDMSPLHVTYVNKKLKENQRDEIRLAKQFCKSAKVYGAESYIKGFSGHILDLLIIHYGSFEKLITAATKWKPKMVIDLEKHLKDPIKQLDKAKTHSPLIIVDPIQPDRNAAAAMNMEKFSLFVEACWKFLKNPSIEFFRVKPIVKKEIKLDEDEQLIFMEALPLKGKKDIIGAKLLKTFQFLRAKIRKNDFELVDSGFEFIDKGIMYFIIKKEILSKTMIMAGPPLTEKIGVERFREKHKNTFVENNRLYAEENRKYREIDNLIKDSLKDKYIKERTKKISVC